MEAERRQVGPDGCRRIVDSRPAVRLDVRMPCGETRLHDGRIDEGEPLELAVWRRQAYGESSDLSALGLFARRSREEGLHRGPIKAVGRCLLGLHSRLVAIVLVGRLALYLLPRSLPVIRGCR